MENHPLKRALRSDYCTNGEGTLWLNSFLLFDFPSPQWIIATGAPLYKNDERNILWV